MADSYIDAFEALIYGKLACEEMRAKVMPLHAEWAPAVERAIALQQSANERVQSLLSRIDDFKVDQDEMAEVADTIVRFGAWLSSLKGRPLDPAVFFGGAAPSTVGSRRLSKVIGVLEHMIARLEPHAEAGATDPVAGAAGRLAELREAHAMAVRNRDALRAAMEVQKTLSPEVEEARRAWLATYVANKRLIEGILRHHGVQTLMPLVFDDLAEVQRTGASGEETEGLETEPTEAEREPADPASPPPEPTDADPDVDGPPVA